MAPETVTTSPTAVVCAAVEQLQARFFEPLSAAKLLRESWQGVGRRLVNRCDSMRAMSLECGTPKCRIRECRADRVGRRVSRADE